MMRLLSVLLLLAATTAAAYLMFSEDRGPSQKSAADRAEGDSPAEPDPSKRPSGPGRPSGRPRLGPQDPAPRPPKRPKLISPAPDRVELESGEPGTDLSGAVLTPSGTPLQGAEVKLYRTDPDVVSTTDRVRVREVFTTPESGRFRFEALAGGRGYLVRVSHPAFAPAESGRTEVVVGTETVVPDVMLASGSTLRGFVWRSGAESGVQDAVVSLRDMMKPIGIGEFQIVAQVLTDQDGGFRFENLAAGTYDLTASAESFADQRSSSIPLGTRGSEDKRIDLRLQTGQVITGRTKDTEGRPIDGVAVELRPMIGAGRLVFRAKTGPEGKFRIDGLPEGEYRVTAELKGYHSIPLEHIDAGSKNITVTLMATAGVSGYVVGPDGKQPLKSFGLQVWSLGKNDTPSHVVNDLKSYRSEDGSFTIDDLPPGRYQVKAFHNDYRATKSRPFDVRRVYVHGLVIPMEVGAALAGKVVNGNGDPVAKAKVSLLSNVFQDGPLAKMLYGREARLGNTRTDDDGQFKFDNLEAGAYQVRIEAGGLAPLTQADVAVVDGETNTCGPFQMVVGAELIVTAFDSRGVPARGAKVYVKGEFGSLEAVIDKDGEKRFTNLMPGRYIVSVMSTTTPNAGNVLTAAIQSARDQKTVDLVDGAKEKASFNVP